MTMTSNYVSDVQHFFFVEIHLYFNFWVQKMDINAMELLKQEVRILKCKKLWNQYFFKYFSGKFSIYG